MQLITQGAQGIKWTSFARVLRQIVQFITVIILARILHPSDFGLMGIALIVINFLNTIRDFGLGSALIQKSEIDNKIIATSFYLNILGSGLLCIIVVLLAPMLASILSNENEMHIKLIDIIRVLAITFFISSSSLIQQSILEKKLFFKTLAIIEIVSVLAGSISGIIFAINGGGVWSLVIQHSVFIIFLAVGIIINAGFPDYNLFQINSVRSIYKYSLNLLGFNIVNYITRNVDYFLIGKFLGSTELGIYSLAYRIMLYPIQNITNIISRVMLPIYSRIKNDLMEYRFIYKNVTFIIASITFPLMFGLMVLSKEFILLFLGNKWQMVAVLLLFISPIGAIQSITTTTGSIFQSMGKTNIMFKWGLISSIIFSIAFVVGLNWGLEGIAAAYLFSNLILFYPWLKIPFKIIKLDVLELLKTLKGIIISTILLVISILFLNTFLINSLNNVGVFSIILLIDVLIYFSVLFLLEKGRIIKIYKQIIE